MQGIIFTLFSDMVVETFGMDMWNSVLASAEVASGGVYTSGKSYDDAEMLALLNELCTRIRLQPDVVMQAFGEYIFPHLVNTVPENLINRKSFPELLQSIESVIHAEVCRLSPEAQPPFIRCNQYNNLLYLQYRSTRGLCAVCEGILQGAAKHYQLHIQIKHTQCQHRGDDECVFEIHGGVA